MEKAGVKTRDISFYSHKNEEMVRVHAKTARDFAKLLEECPDVQRYEAGKLLELPRLPHISPVGIRKLYFQTQWCSDFYIIYADGHIGVRELVSQDALQQRAVVERLELSRRYWGGMDISDWKVVLAP